MHLIYQNKRARVPSCHLEVIKDKSSYFLIIMNINLLQWFLLQRSRLRESKAVVLWGQRLLIYKIIMKRIVDGKTHNGEDKNSANTSSRIMSLDPSRVFTQYDEWALTYWYEQASRYAFWLINKMISIEIRIDIGPF